MRLIDAENLLRFFTYSPSGERYKTRDIDNFPVTVSLEAVQRKIASCPTVDAVEVVRCKECKHFNLQSMKCENDAVLTDHEGGASYSLSFYLDDFCSYGERRNDDAAD